MTLPAKAQFKRLSDVTASELAYVATPVFAQRQLIEKSATIQGTPAGLQAQQLEAGEWVLLCDASQSTQASNLAFNKSLGRWVVHASINGNARIKFQMRLSIISPLANRPPASSSSSRVQ